MRIIQISAPKNFNYFLLSDFHIGSVLFSYNAFDKMKELINSKYRGCGINKAFLGGDLIEAISVDDRRFDPHFQGAAFPGLQIEEAIKLFKPISHKIVVSLWGNHEFAVMRYEDVLRRFLNELNKVKRTNIIYGGFNCIVEFYQKNTNNLMFRHFGTHGRKLINSAADDIKRRKTNMKLILKRHLKDRVGHCVLMTKAHTHRCLIARPAREEYWADNDGFLDTYRIYTEQNLDFIPPDERWYVNTGCFMKPWNLGIDGYGERAEYSAIPPAFAIVCIREGKIVEIDRIPLYGSESDKIEKYKSMEISK